MGTISEFYNGELLPKENFGYPEEQEYLDLIQDVQELETSLLSGMGEKEQKVYQEIQQSKIMLSNMELERMFQYAFRMACRLTMDIFQE